MATARSDAGASASRRSREQVRRDVPRRGRADPGPAHPLGGGKPILDFSLELLAAAGNQVVARIGQPRLRVRVRPLLGSPNRAPRDFQLRNAAAVREFLDCAAVAVARREVHLGDPRSVAQGRLDQAHALEEVSPVHRGEQAHARDDVADSYVRRHLNLVLLPDDLLRIGAFRLEAPAQPGERGSDRRILVAQAGEKLNQKCVRERAILQILERAQAPDGSGGVNSEQVIGDRIGLFSVGAPPVDALD